MDPRWTLMSGGAPLQELYLGAGSCPPGPVAGSTQRPVSSLAGPGTYQGWTARTLRMKRAALCETLGYSLKASKRPARMRFSVSMGSSSKNGDLPLSLSG